MADAAEEKKKIKQSLKKKNAKRRTRNPEEWHKQKQKRLRIAGKAHLNSNGKIIPEKTPGEDCKCRRKCFERVPEAVRLKTFEGFYSMKSHDEQNAYLFGLMRQIDIKRKRRKNSSRRTCTFEYFIRVRGRETQVCQTAFKNIHAITERKVRVLCKKMDDGIMFPSDNRGKNNAGRAGVVRLPQDIINQIKSHIYTIVHSHRLKDFIRVDKATGLEINISKMWKDYIKTHDPSNAFLTVTKNKKKPPVIKESPEPTPPLIQTITPNNVMPQPSSESYCLAYTSTGNVMNLTDNYVTQTVVPQQYTNQQISLDGFLIPEKMMYISPGQVIVQSNNIQQLIQTSAPVQTTLQTPNSSQQTFVTTNRPETTNSYLILQTIEPRSIKSEQRSAEAPSDFKSDAKVVKKKGPNVKQWRYTSIFHDEINGVALAAIKTRLPLYYSEKYSSKKKIPTGKSQKVEQLEQIQMQNQQQQQQQQLQQQHQQQQQHQHQQQQHQQQQQHEQQQQHHHQQQQQFSQQQCQPIICQRQQCTQLNVIYQPQECAPQHCQPVQQLQQTIVGSIPQNIFNTFTTNKT